MSNNNSVFGFDKSGYLQDSEIEELYLEKLKLVNNKEVQDKLFRASFYDPRKSDIYFSSVESANKGKEIADKLDKMAAEEFLSSDYVYQWFDELSGASLFKVVNKNVLKPLKGGDKKHMIKKLLQFVRTHRLWVLIVLIAIFLFYWFQIRPVRIKSYCDWSVRWGEDRPRGYGSYSPTGKYYEEMYSGCLHRKGLK